MSHPVAQQPPHAKVTIQQMQAAVISTGTFDGYKYEIWRLLQYALVVRNIQLQWLDTFARDQLHVINHNIEQARGRAAKAKVKCEGLRAMLDNCPESPILQVNNVTPENYMTFFQFQREEGGGFLKGSNYRGKSSTLFHLFRCHANLDGYPPGFEARLKVLRTGFL